MASMIGGNVGGGDAGGFEALARAAGREGLDGDGIAGMNGDGGFGGGIVIAPNDGLRGGEQRLGLLG